MDVSSLLRLTAVLANQNLVAIKPPLLTACASWWSRSANRPSQVVGGTLAETGPPAGRAPDIRNPAVEQAARGIGSGQAAPKRKQAPTSSPTPALTLRGLPVFQCAKHPCRTPCATTRRLRRNLSLAGLAQKLTVSGHASERGQRAWRYA